MRRPSLAAIVLPCLVLAAPAVAQDATATQYDPGDPTDDQQLLIELINRARADPAAEGDRIAADYGSADVKAMVDWSLGADPRTWTRAENQAAWQGYTAQPPLAFNRALAFSANQWSVAMRAHDAQGQSLPGETSLAVRLFQNGYFATWSGQLINAYAPDVLTAHASWTIDPGQVIDAGTGRPGLWNREAIINPHGLDFLDFVEVGPGFVRRNNPPPGGVGPLVSTLVLGSPGASQRRYVTGVVYDDLDGDGAWDPGEGLPGVRIDVDGSGSYALSSRSGGYAVPVNGHAGPVTATARGVAGEASEIFRAQSRSGSTFAFGRPGNVKADFVLLPREDPPAAVTFDAAPGPVAGDATTGFPIVVAGVHAERPSVGDVDLSLDLAHPDRGRVRVRLRSPAGTELVLWQASATGSDIVGTFDASLHPVESLRAFVDEAWAGTWTLFVDDTSGQAGSLRSATLAIRPRWEGPLLAQRAHLFVEKLDVKDKRKAAADRLSVKADLEIGTMLDVSTGPLAIVLRTGDDDRVELIRLDAAAALAAGGSAATADGELFVRLDPALRDTSRARLTATLRRADLPAIPADVRVEVLAGDAFVAATVRLTRGRFRGRRTPPLFDAGVRLERVRSKVRPLGRRTTVRGRYLARGLPFVAPIAEVRVGGVTALWRAAPIVHDETRIEYPRNGPVKRLVLRPRRRTFTLTLDGSHEILDPDGNVRLSLWLGAFYGEADVTPVVDGSGVNY